jgi:hypothetical protein
MKYHLVRCHSGQKSTTTYEGFQSDVFGSGYSVQNGFRVLLSFTALSRTTHRCRHADEEEMISQSRAWCKVLEWRSIRTCDAENLSVGLMYRQTQAASRNVESEGECNRSSSNPTRDMGRLGA